MRIKMQAALTSLQEQGRLAIAANAASRPSPSLSDSLSPPRQEAQAPEHESVIWLRAVIECDRALDSALIGMAGRDGGSEQASAHVNRHDFEDAVARCEAELKLLDLHVPNRYGYCLTCDPDSCGCVGSGDYPCYTIKALLSGYRHRGGFKPEWVNA
ncbi:DUF6221 family protein [Nonomuraea basaltis]|uniref:DUF6221 family protein n=1 Tax=Nonomuraea basaltis TaxID=2495887 RepID=UPI00110C68B4|nr:DUF6221 family protein [Nonomuraea basaltis]TMS00175.1 hypothetical protein EJK15_03630 [Nonomuraea basaltis]